MEFSFSKSKENKLLLEREEERKEEEREEMKLYKNYETKFKVLFTPQENTKLIVQSKSIM